MIRPTPEQSTALAEAQASTTKQELRNQKARFIGKFLRFADKIAPIDSRIPTGRILDPSGETYWQTESTSRVVEIEHEPGSPDMGASVTAYRTGFTKAGLLRFLSLGSHVHAADVNVGVMLSNCDPYYSPTPKGHLRPAPVLRLVEHPPAVYYGANGTELSNVEPATEAWGTVNALVEVLYAQEQEFTGDSSVPVRTV